MAPPPDGQATLGLPSRADRTFWHRVASVGRRTLWGRQTAVRDYARRVWENSAEDNIFFLASGVAFNILLAAIPLFLLLVSGLGYVLNMSPVVSLGNMSTLLDRLLPPESQTARALIDKLLFDVVRGRGQVGLYGAVGFVWFSTRLFGSLRSVLASVFDIDRDRGIIAGKLFDAGVTIASMLLVVSYTVISAYLAIATTRGAQLLVDLGVERSMMGTLVYTAGRALAFVVIGLMFFCLYKYLPSRRIRAQKAWVSAAVAATLFELARIAFRIYIHHFNPGSVYTGALAAFVILILWIYYAALVFVIGGEIGQVYELRRTRRMRMSI